MNSFKEWDLDPKIVKGIDSAGYMKPTPIQERAISPLLKGLDVIGQAKTGTGKTAAFGIPLLQTINTTHREIQALILSPTRELAVQITEEIKKIGRFTGAKIVTVYGGQSINVQFEALRRGPQVVVGTPGRLIDHIKRGTLDLSSVKYVVIDEADVMLDMGFIEDVEFILDTMPDKKQISLFSATMPYRIIDLSERYMSKPEKILIDSDEPSVDELDQYFTIAEQEAKQDVLAQILEKEKPKSTMIFCRTKYGAHRLARELDRKGLSAVPLHGDLSQNQRDHSMGLFRAGHVEILVATDVASRGIDIRHVDCVINYDLPQTPELYFHRVGRTARAGDPGRSFTLVSPKELYDFERIRKLTKVVIKPMTPEDEKHAQRASERPQRRGFERRRFTSRRGYGGSSGGRGGSTGAKRYGGSSGERRYGGSSEGRRYGNSSGERSSSGRRKSYVRGRSE